MGRKKDVRSMSFAMQYMFSGKGKGLGRNKKKKKKKALEKAAGEIYPATSSQGV